MDSHNTARDTYRLIVTRRNASEILVLTRGPACFLPTVEIPQGQRIAEQLGAELYSQCGCRGYCLLVPSLGGGLPSCAVMEVPDLQEIPSARACWKRLDGATCLAIESAENRMVIQESIEELDLYRQEPNQEPFARPGWLPELFAWAQEQLGPLGLRLTGAFTQLNASPTFSLIRLETNDSAVWFKATGPPNRHELPVTMCVARLFPGYVPELLGVHAAWNGWLTRDVPGRTLDHGADLPSWLKVAGDLAQLQILSVGRQAELLDGAHMDLRLPRLIEVVDPWIERMRGLMAAQEKQTPARLTDSEFTLLRSCLKQACSLLSKIGLPDTLGHLDLNPGNIVIFPERCVFLDWAEACLTNPLLTFEYLCEHFRRNCTNDAAATRSLIAVYTRPWQALVSLDDLNQAAAFSPLVAVFAYAVAADARRSSETCANSFAGGYLRSLGRRMFREAEKMMHRSERCLA